MTVIDHQRHAAFDREASRDRPDCVIARGGRLDDLAVAVEGETAGGDEHAPFNAADGSVQSVRMMTQRAELQSYSSTRDFEMVEL